MTRPFHREASTPPAPRRLRSAAVPLLLLLFYSCATAPAKPGPVNGVAAAPAADSMHGIASWYGEEFAGRTTANGEIFEPLLLTAAHRTLPFGTIVDVKNSQTGQTVRVRINDRGPFVAERLIDLSYAAAKEIGLVEPGSGDVDVTVVSVGRGEHEPPAPYTVTLAQSKGPLPAPAPPMQVPEPVVAAPVPTAAAEVATVEPSPAPAAVSATAPIDPEKAMIVPAEAAAALVAAVPEPSTAAPVPAVGVAAAPPAVEFPLPGEAATPAPPAVADKTAQPTPAPAEVSNVQVVEERQGVETRRQVAADGRSVETVAAASGQPVASAPGHSTAEALDKARSRSQAPTSPRTHHYLVQVGAFSVEANAKALVDLLAGFGMKARVDHETTLYRVRLGPFASREEAIRARSNLEGRGVSAIVIGE